MYTPATNLTPRQRIRFIGNEKERFHELMTTMLPSISAAAAAAAAACVPRARPHYLSINASSRWRPWQPASLPPAALPLPWHWPPVPTSCQHARAHTRTNTCTHTHACAQACTRACTHGDGVGNGDAHASTQTNRHHMQRTNRHALKSALTQDKCAHKQARKENACKPTTRPRRDSTRHTRQDRIPLLLPPP